MANQTQMVANQANMASELKNKQLATRDLEKQMGQIAVAQHNRPQGGLPNDIDKNPWQVMDISLRSGKQLADALTKERKNEVQPELVRLGPLAVKGDN